MLKIKVIKHQDQIEKIVFEGHAMYDDYGKDIVCSAASSIMITTVNGILSFDQSYLMVDQTPDKIVIQVLKHNDITNHLIMNMIHLLKELEHDYPANLKIMN